MMKINANESVTITVTKAGVRAILNSDSDYLWKQINTTTMDLKLQLHELMRVFGPHMHVGMPEPLFEKNEIKTGGDGSVPRGERT